MKSRIREIRKHRVYSEAFKRELVSLFESGKFSVLQLEKLYGVCDSTVYNWIYKYSVFQEKGVRVVEMNQSSTNKLKELESKIKELERLIGQKQIRIDFLEKMIDVAQEELKVDIKKNSFTPPSGGSKHTKRQ